MALALIFLIGINLVFSSNGINSTDITNSDSTNPDPTQVFDEEEVSQRLDTIDSEVSDIVSELYRLEQFIQESKLRINRLQEEQAKTEEKIRQTREEILKKQEEIQSYESTLGQVLATYQRMGATSFLEILLESENLKNLLQRITLFQDMTRNTGDLMMKIEDALVELDQTERLLQETRVALMEEEEELSRVILENQQYVEEQELYLASLEDERDVYEEQLQLLRQAWSDLKPVFKSASEEFLNLVSSGTLTEDMVDISISFTGISARISEADFNQAVLDNERLPSMVFSIEDEGITININEDVLELRGYFEVQNNYELHYVPTSAYFYGINLEPSSIEELFEEGELVLDLTNILDTDRVKRVKSVKTQDDVLILEFAVSLFN